GLPGCRGPWAHSRAYTWDGAGPWKSRPAQVGQEPGERPASAHGTGGGREGQRGAHRPGARALGRDPAPDTTPRTGGSRAGVLVWGDATVPALRRHPPRAVGRAVVAADRHRRGRHAR